MNNSLKTSDSNFLHVFGMPIIVAIVSVFGLVSALLGTGIWDALSWITLAVPTLVIIYFVWIKEKIRNHKQKREY